MELESYVSASLDQAASGSLPLVVAAHDAAGDGGRLGEIDELCDAFTSNHVANRASRLQGRAFHAAAVKLLPPGETVGPWPCGHLAPVFGAVLRRLGVDVEAAARLFVFHHVRGLLAAAVRLNIIGPMQAQVLQHRWQPRLATAASRARHRSVEDLAQTAPLLDLWQAAQDRLYSRLFQS